MINVILDIKSNSCKSKLKSGATLACVHILHVQSSEHDRNISKWHRNVKHQR